MRSVAPIARLQSARRSHSRSRTGRRIAPVTRRETDLIGETLSHYRITAAIGRGGMGEVFRATDLRLGREVALKLLPPAFAADATRLARFDREAKLLAQLSHSSIAHLYECETAVRPDGSTVHLIAMELVDGEDLAERLRRGRLPVDEAIAIARRIAEALEAAHEKGIVHRDLKPANVKLSPDGEVKVLDFGLAKAWSPDSSGIGSSADFSQSPTLAMSGTADGILLGTASYMSPEQARGRAVDKRTDVWAFGAVLYEMLTGARLFEGETVSDVLASVLRTEPDWKALPRSTPSGVRTLLRRCLERDAKMRLRDIGEARIALSDARPEEPEAAPADARTAPARGRCFPGRWRCSPSRWRSPSPPGRRPAGRSRERTRAGGRPPRPRLPRRRRARRRPAGRDRARAGRLRRRDGRLPPEPAAALRAAARRGRRERRGRDLGRRDVLTDGGAWRSSRPRPPVAALARRRPDDPARDGRRLRERREPRLGRGRHLLHEAGALWAVPVDGGEARALTTLDTSAGEMLHADPLVLPGGKTLLFSRLTTSPGSERIEAVPVGGGRRTVVLEGATTPVWSTSGHLLFARAGAVWSVPFDPDKAAVVGAAVPVIARGVVGNVRTGSLGFQLAANGTLAFIPAEFDSQRFVSVDRAGAERPLRLATAGYGTPRISPDGRTVAVVRDGTVVESVDLARGTTAVAVPAAVGTVFPVWTSDGSRLVVRRFTVPFWAAADGSGRTGMVPYGDTNTSPAAPGPDPGSFLAIRQTPETGGDLYLMSVDGAFPPKPLVATPAYEGGPSSRRTVAGSSTSRTPRASRRSTSGATRSSTGRGPSPRRRRAVPLEREGHRDLLPRRRELLLRRLRRHRRRAAPRPTGPALRGRLRLRPGALDPELRRHRRRPLPDAAAQRPRRHAARRAELDRGDEADDRGGRPALSERRTGRRAPTARRSGGSGCPGPSSSRA
ncbi:MAG: protein kinase [Vicinamibacteria bacterium]